jgi:uncharacterized protein (TIGR03086 family)
MTFVDLEPAARRMADLVVATSDDDLDLPTPCPAYTVRDLLDHIRSLALGFTAAATRSGIGGPGSAPPIGDGRNLGQDWRDRIPRYLASLTDAWRDPAARSGMTRAGGVELPGEVAAVVALEELVVHGWDLARATGQTYDLDDPLVLSAVAGFFGGFPVEARGDAYGAPVEIEEEAPHLDRVIALSGRDPGWRRQR